MKEMTPTQRAYTLLLAGDKEAALRELETQVKEELFGDWLQEQIHNPLPDGAAGSLFGRWLDSRMSGQGAGGGAESGPGSHDDLNVIAEHARRAHKDYPHNIMVALKQEEKTPEFQTQTLTEAAEPKQLQRTDRKPRMGEQVGEPNPIEELRRASADVSNWRAVFNPGEDQPEQEVEEAPAGKPQAGPKAEVEAGVLGLVKPDGSGQISVLKLNASLMEKFGMSPINQSTADQLGVHPSALNKLASHKGNTIQSKHALKLAVILGSQILAY